MHEAGLHGNPEGPFFALTVTLGRWPGTRTLTFAFGCFCA